MENECPQNGAFKSNLSCGLINFPYTSNTQLYKFLYFFKYTLTKIINVTHLFSPHLSRAELKDLRLFLCTQKAYFSQILFTNLSKSLLVSTSPLPIKSIHLTGVAYQDAD